MWLLLGQYYCQPADDNNDNEIVQDDVVADDDKEFEMPCYDPRSVVRVAVSAASMFECQVMGFQGRTVQVSQRAPSRSSDDFFVVN